MAVALAAWHTSLSFSPRQSLTSSSPLEAQEESIASRRPAFSFLPPFRPRAVFQENQVQTVQGEGERQKAELSPSRVSFGK